MISRVREYIKEVTTQNVAYSFTPCWEFSGVVRIVDEATG
jgi:hypothetical protein